MGVKSRLYEFIDHKGLSVASFERQCELSNGFCSKVKDNITSGPLLLIQKAFPELSIEWLKTGKGEMLSADNPLENSNYPDRDNNMLAMVKMMQEFIILGKKNADANLINAEANRLNAQNLDRLITLLENKIG